MAYILLALGASMSLVGLAAMVTGYPMIEIERGWAMVITGAVLLSGGLVVVALGLVVRHLIGLRGALSAVVTLPSATEAPVPQPAVVPTPLVPSQPAMPAAPPPFETREAPAFGAGSALGVAVPAAAAALAAGAVHRHEEHDAPRFHATPAELHETEPHAENARVPEAYVPDVRAQEPHAQEHPAREVDAIEPPVPSQDHEPVHDEPADAFAEARDAVGRAEPEHRENDRDWLDQAFSAFDYEMANGHAPSNVPAETSAAEPTHAVEAGHDTSTLVAEEEDAGEPHSLEAYDHEPQSTHHEAEPHAPHAEAPATAPSEAAANLAVIGRYDSEGTSYVMYSDGSIEAQSEAGVYRFGSMAELKAFIEG